MFGSLWVSARVPDIFLPVSRLLTRLFPTPIAVIVAPAAASQEEEEATGAAAAVNVIFVGLFVVVIGVQLLGRSRMVQFVACAVGQTPSFVSSWRRR